MEAKDEGKLSEGKDGDSKAESKGAAGGDILDKVSSFVMSSGFERDFELFAQKHGSTFDKAVDMQKGDEHSLEFHEVYQEYLSTFEGKIEGFVSENGSTIEEFRRLAQAALQDPDTDFERRFFIEALLSTTEYDVFFGLMKNEAKRLRTVGK
mmetsp:Transcript_22754/g.51316  ORF Transcript_22754/g.51316 Transcript_22754/m.51316 type:complete len:152 (+) Transcript_22754:193-648(+)